MYSPSRSPPPTSLSSQSLWVFLVHQVWALVSCIQPGLVICFTLEETRSERDTCTPVFITALFVIARTWKQPRCPSADEWKLFYYNFDFHCCDGMLRFSVSSWFSFGRLYFSKNLSIFSNLSHFIAIQFFIVICYDPLYFCVVHCNFSFFISNFIDLSLLPFFLGESGYRFVSFVYLLKEPAFSFIDLIWSRKVVLTIPCAGQQRRHRCREQTSGHNG